MTDLIDELWKRFGTVTIDDLPDDVVTVAGQSILDWFGCALAGSAEPLTGILRDELALPDGPCSLVGSQLRGDPMRAAMINGAAGHALDFDDTSPVMAGQASVPMVPALLAVAESVGADGRQLLEAFVTGMEIQSRIGASIGSDHYRRGWHRTSTVGVFGAAGGAARLLGLDERGFGTALGLAASSASGLKANFGTMTKPLHAGQAAERGVLAARLAAAGYTANPGAIDGKQGLAEAAGDGALHQSALERWRDGWATPHTLFKFHAACHMTHPALEATAALIAGTRAEDIENVTLTVNPAILDVCGIPSPTTGLEAKFSLRGTQALLVHGADTGSIETFTDDPINRPEVQAFLDRVEIELDDSIHTLATRVAVRTADGVRTAEADVSRPAGDLSVQGTKLRAKFDSLAVPILGSARAASLGDALVHLEAVTHVRDLMELAR